MFSGPTYISSVFQSRQAVDESVEDVLTVLLDQIIDVSENATGKNQRNALLKSLSDHLPHGCSALSTTVRNEREERNY